MRPSRRTLILVPLVAGLVAPAPSLSAENDMTAFAASGNAFGLDLWKRLPASGNQVFSPASITTALAMTWGGAKGETAAEMGKALHFTGTAKEVMDASGRLSLSLTDPTRPLVFRIANRLFGDATFRFEPPFLAATKAAYGAPLESVDFAGAPEKPASKSTAGWRRRRRSASPTSSPRAASPRRPASC